MGRPATVSKEKLYELYITQNKTQQEIADMYNVSQGVIAGLIKRYGIKKDKSISSQQRKETNLKKYGATCSAQGKEIKEKIKQTNIAKYGAEHPIATEVVRNKRKETMLERYGVENPYQHKEFRDKAIKTFKERYGTTNVFDVEEFREKRNQTNIERFGSISPLTNEEIKKKTIATNLKKYGSETYVGSQTFREKMIEDGRYKIFFGKTVSEWCREYPDVPERSFRTWTENNPNVDEETFIGYLTGYQRHLTNIENLISQKLGIPKFDKKITAGVVYRPDFQLKDNLFLNVDGLYWHSEKVIKDKDYHFNMRRRFENAGMRIFQFRAHEVFCNLPIVLSVINNALGKTPNKIGARKTELKEVSIAEAQSFLSQNHLKGYKSAKNIGLYYKGELVSIMSFKRGQHPKTKQKIVKIERFCSKVDTNVIGAFNKLLKFIIQEVGNLPIHYWVDLRYGTGKFLLQNGFEQVGESLGWEWTDLETTYNRLKCRANMDERGLSEKQHAEELYWYKIYDAGQRLYVRN